MGIELDDDDADRGTGDRAECGGYRHGHRKLLVRADWDLDRLRWLRQKWYAVQDSVHIVVGTRPSVSSPEGYSVAGIGSAMRLSIVTTMYMSEPYVHEFHRRARAAADKLTRDLEIIFVDDGSPDGSLDQAVSLLTDDPCVRVIQLSRNFGHHKAMMTGLAHATGDLVFLIDSDLEEDPALLEPFHEKLVTTGADVVFGRQARRSGGWWKNVGPKIHYRASALLSTPPMHENVLTVRLMKGDYVRALVKHQERELSIAGLWQITGFHQVPMFVNKASKGTSTYTFAHKVANLVDAVTSFSNKPLVFIFYLGAAILAASTLAAGYLIVKRVFFQDFLGGWPSVIVSIWLLGGLTIFCLGLIGIYISKIFVETKQRPYTIVQRIYGPNFTPEDPPSMSPPRADNASQKVPSVRREFTDEHDRRQA